MNISHKRLDSLEYKRLSQARSSDPVEGTIYSITIFFILTALRFIWYYSLETNTPSKIPVQWLFCFCTKVCLYPRINTDNYHTLTKGVLARLSFQSLSYVFLSFCSLLLEMIIYNSVHRFSQWFEMQFYCYHG